MFLYGHMFRILHSYTSQVLTNTLASMDLTSSQGTVLMYLVNCEKVLCPKDVEEHFQLSHPTVSGLLSRLEKKGFIELRTDAQDRRCKRIYVAPKGMECYDVIQETIEENEGRIVQGFTPEEQELFSKLLMKAIQNVGGEIHLPKQEEVYKK